MFLDIPKEKLTTESYGEICQRVIYYTYKIYDYAAKLAIKSKHNNIPFKITLEIDDEKLKELPKNEQQYFLDFVTEQRTPMNQNFPRNEREFEIQHQAFKDLFDDF